jgi:uncharacterized membrane protein YfcA
VSTAGAFAGFFGFDFGFGLVLVLLWRSRVAFSLASA